MIRKMDIKSEKAAYIKRFAIRIFTSYRGAWLFLFACWLVPFLAAWPGIYVIDNGFWRGRLALTIRLFIRICWGGF